MKQCLMLHSIGSIRDLLPQQAEIVSRSQDVQKTWAHKVSTFWDVVTQAS